MIGKEKCPCKHPSCKDYHLTGIGKFVQGSGFTEEEADRIINALNNGIPTTPRELTKGMRGD